MTGLNKMIWRPLVTRIPAPCADPAARALRTYTVWCLRAVVAWRLGGMVITDFYCMVGEWWAGTVGPHISPDAYLPTSCSPHLHCHGTSYPSLSHGSQARWHGNHSLIMYERVNDGRQICRPLADQVPTPLFADQLLAHSAPTPHGASLPSCHMAAKLGGMVITGIFYYMSGVNDGRQVVGPHDRSTTPYLPTAARTSAHTLFMVPRGCLRCKLGA
jgi:hypothetical protein